MATKLMETCTDEQLTIYSFFGRHNNNPSYKTEKSAIEKPEKEFWRLKKLKASIRIVSRDTRMKNNTKKTKKLL